MSVRNYETVTSVLKTLNESIVLCTSPAPRQQPYDVPISQLLRHERCRGFEYEHSHSQKSISPECRRISSDLNTPGEGWHKSPRSRYVVQVYAARRRFSTHTAREKPPPSKKPPPPPPRKPAIAAHGRIAANPPVEDSLSRIAFLTTTGEEQNRQKETAQTKAANKETQKALDKGPWWDSFRCCEREARRRFNLDGGPPNAAKFLEDVLGQARIEGLQKLEIEYNKTEQRLKKLVNKGEQLDRIYGYKRQIEVNMKSAKEKGKGDFAFEQHLIGLGIRSLMDQAKILAKKERSLRMELAELKYNSDLQRWKQEMTEYRLTEAIQETLELKAMSGRHHQITNNIASLAGTGEKLARCLSRLENDLKGVRYSVHSSQSAMYKCILRLPFAAWADAHLPTLGHRWRMTNRISLAAVRMPELVEHLLPDIEYAMLTGEIRDCNTDLHHLVRSLDSKRMLGRRAQLLIRLSRAQSALQQGTNGVMSDYGVFLQQGMILSNPVMSTKSGLLKYAALSPFYTYSVMRQTTETALRHVAEVLQSSSKNQNGTKVTAWRTNAIHLVQHLLEEESEISRGFNEALRQFEFMVSVRVSEGHWPFLGKVLARMNKEAKDSLKHLHAFQDLSRPEIYRNQTQSEKMIEPLRLSGAKRLYPSKKSYPVEYLTSEYKIWEVLSEFRQSKVLGIELLRVAQAAQPYPDYLVIANTEKVAIIESGNSVQFTRTGGTFRYSLFGQILEDPNIVKVFRNMDNIERLDMGRRYTLKSIVSLESMKPTARLNVKVRKTSEDSWPKAAVLDRFRKSLPCFLTDLAWSASFNLVTFLNGATPERLIHVEPNLMTNILQAREQLRCKLSEYSDAGVELGSISWDHDKSSHSLIYGLHINQKQSDSNLAEITRAEATKQLAKQYTEIKDKGKFRVAEEMLAAYYMFTTFGEDLDTIKALLNLVGNPASYVLEAVQSLQEMSLVLHPADEQKLQEAARDAPSMQAVTEMLQDSVKHIKRASKVSDQSTWKASKFPAEISLVRGKSSQGSSRVSKSKSGMFAGQITFSAKKRIEHKGGPGLVRVKKSDRSSGTKGKHAEKSSLVQETMQGGLPGLRRLPSFLVKMFGRQDPTATSDANALQEILPQMSAYRPPTCGSRRRGRKTETSLQPLPPATRDREPDNEKELRVTSIHPRRRVKRAKRKRTKMDQEEIDRKSNGGASGSEPALSDLSKVNG